MPNGLGLGLDGVDAENKGITGFSSLIELDPNVNAVVVLEKPSFLPNEKGTRALGNWSGNRKFRSWAA
jgi:hypothetical protein